MSESMSRTRRGVLVAVSAVMALTASSIAGVVGAAQADEPALVWSDPVQVAPGMTDITEVKTARAWNGTTVAAGFRTPDGNAYATVSTDGGKSWTAPERLNAAPAGTVAGTVDAAISGDGTHIVGTWVQACPGGECAYSRASADGGKTWMDAVKVGAARDAVTHTGALVSPYGGATGDRYAVSVVWVSKTGGKWKMEVANSRSGGSSFYNPFDLVNSDDPISEVSQSVILDYKEVLSGTKEPQGVVLHLQGQPGAAQIRATSLNKLGVDYPDIATADVGSAGELAGLRLATGDDAWKYDDGTAHAVWTDETTGAVKRSTRSNETPKWSVPVDLSPAGSAAKTPDLTTSDGAAEVVAVYVADTPDGPRVQAAFSRDIGQTWSAPAGVSGPGSVADPSVSSSRTGQRVLTLWSRADGAAPGMEAATSADYGQSWSAPVPLPAPGGPVKDPEGFVFEDGTSFLATAVVPGKGLVAYPGVLPAPPVTPPGPEAPAGGEIVDGPVQVTMPECGPTPKDKKSTFFDQKVADCSYVTFVTAKGGSTEFLYFTNQGPVSWIGSVANRAFTFPANDQTWPNLTGLSSGASITWAPKAVTGSISADQKVSLTLDLEANIAPLSCKVQGQIQVSTDGTEPRGQSAGLSYNPANGHFAVAAPVTPVASTSPGCGSQLNPLDLAQGWSAFLTGTISQSNIAPVVPPTQQPKPPATSGKKKVTKVTASAVAKRSKLKVRVRPDLGAKKQWKFQVLAKKGGKFRALKGKTWTTKTAKHTRTLNLKKGTYKVRVVKQRGYKASTSKAVTLKR